MMNRLLKRLNLTWKVLRTGQVKQRGERQIPQITVEEMAEVKEFFPMEKYFQEIEPASFDYLTKGANLIFLLP